MKITLLVIGKMSDSFLKEGVELYQKRLHKYVRFIYKELKDVKHAGNLSSEELKERELTVFLNQIKASDFVVLLDEKGKTFRSTAFAAQLEKWMVQGISDITFIIGGAWGCSEKLKQRANVLLSLSDMTFSHQLVRIIFLEQLYRAFTIIHNEPYHNN